MSDADTRASELLARWMSSVELHARYLALDDAAYARVQKWPKHERPSRWVVDLARKRLSELSRLLAQRTAKGDVEFAEALELMAFLTTLLGSEHIERFIPLARAGEPGARSGPARAPAAPVDPTVKRPTLRSGSAAPSARRSESSSAPARATKAPAPATRRKAPAQSQGTRPAAPAPVTRDRVEATVIADAVRLLSWGREWPQLAGLIARLADRPPEAVVWEILRRHRAGIEATARRPRA